MVKVICIIWFVAMLIDNILPVILAEFYWGYSPKTQALSVLGCRQSPRTIKWIYNIWCIISGVIFCWGAYGVYRIYGGGLSIALWCLLALYGFGCEFLSGLFPVNEHKEEKSVSSQIHGVGSAIGFTLLVFTPLLLCIQAFRLQNNILGLFSAFCFSLYMFRYFYNRRKSKVSENGSLLRRIVATIGSCTRLCSSDRFLYTTIRLGDCVVSELQKRCLFLFFNTNARKRAGR